MEPVWSKFDNVLTDIYSTYLAIKSNPVTPGQYLHAVLKNNREEIFLRLQYKGNLQELEAIGFKTISVEREGVAKGRVMYERLGDLSAHPDVIKLVYGEEMHPSIDTSTLEILARGTTVGTDCVWSVAPATGVFTGMTGDEVVIGIIDTGIDYRHESFQKENSTDTRIFRIWDQGLVPVAGEHSPAVGLLSAGPTYGVEYTDANINGALATPATFNVRTRDCNGHGTHVAGIAAGNGKQKNFSSDPRFTFTGVAPKATLVIVKMLYPEIDPGVDSETRFKDAITYILRVAGARQVVINCSFGHDTGPHDGLVEDGIDGQEIFLETTFAAATGKICVFSAGNSARHRQHAIITIPAGGTIEIPFDLDDPRNPKSSFNTCVTVENTFPLGLDFWYNNSVAGVTLSMKQPPPDTAFHPVAGVAVGAALFNYPTALNKEFSIKHITTNVTRNGSPLSRKNIAVTIFPNGLLHRLGRYTAKLTGPVGAVIHVWCRQAKGYQIMLAPDGALPAGVNVTDAGTICAPAHTPSVVTVGAYDDTDGHMACFSSQGPLVDYSGSGVLVAKPELSAPGVKIWSAKSYHTTGGLWADLLFTLRDFVGGYVQKGGTSMAAPHIAGVVALMLQKKPNQTLAQIKTALQSTVRARPQTFPAAEPCPRTSTVALPVTPPVSVDIAGSGKVDAKSGWNSIVP
ncbi:Subtilase family protein [Chitinophaga sp. YR573]|nr:Subtilase family protein [Chitinophaga sp. YR573]